MSSFETVYTEEDIRYYESLPVDKKQLDEFEDEFIDVYNEKIDKQTNIDIDSSKLMSLINQDEKDLDTANEHIHELQKKICKSCRQLQEEIHELELEATGIECRISMKAKAMRYKDMSSDVLGDEIERDSRRLRIIKDKRQYPDEMPVYPYPRPGDGGGCRKIPEYFSEERDHSSTDLSRTTTGNRKRIRLSKNGTEEEN
jgi:hypothetical protein